MDLFTARQVFASIARSRASRVNNMLRWLIEAVMLLPDGGLKSALLAELYQFGDDFINARREILVATREPIDPGKLVLSMDLIGADEGFLMEIEKSLVKLAMLHSFEAIKVVSIPVTRPPDPLRN